MSVHVSARAESALLACLGLAERHPDRVSASALATGQGLAIKFTEAVLADLRRAGIVVSARGHDGGYSLRRPPEELFVGDVLRAVDGPLADVRGHRLDDVAYEGIAVHLGELWVAGRAAVRTVFDEITIAQLLTGEFPPHVRRLLEEPDAWEPRTSFFDDSR